MYRKPFIMNTQAGKNIQLKLANPHKKMLFTKLIKLVLKKRRKAKVEQINKLLSDNEVSIKLIHSQLSQLK